MKREFIVGAVMATAFAIGASAQSTPPSSQSSSDQSSRGQTVTVTGCLLNTDQWKGGTAGTSGTGSTGSATGSTGAAGSTSASRSSGSGGFVLTEVSIGAGSGSPGGAYGGTTGTNPSTSNPSATSGTAGTNPSSPGASAAASPAGTDAFTLKGKENDLKKHVNHRVEIRGTLDKSAGADTSMTNPPPTAAATTGTLTVTSVKEISGSCSGGGNR